jgi:hypothetical protein
LSSQIHRTESRMVAAGGWEESTGRCWTQSCSWKDEKVLEMNGSDIAQHYKCT